MYDHDDDMLDESFYPGRCAEIIFRGRRIGVMGTVHPEVLSAFGIPHATSAIEISMEPLLDVIN